MTPSAIRLPVRPEEALNPPINLHYETHGPEQGEPVLMLMGLGCQIVHWPNALIQGLVEKGLRVILADNRDIGLSPKPAVRKPVNIPLDFMKGRVGLPVDASYTLYDMAADVVHLIDSLGYEKVHLVGVSMGGMIGHIVAGLYTSKIKSFTSIMSTCNPRAIWAKPKIVAHLTGLRGRPKKGDIEAILDFQMDFWRMVHDPSFPFDERTQREVLRKALLRGDGGAGFLRQMQAVMASGNFTHVAKQIKAPTLVIHGEGDPFVPVEAGKHSVRAIPHARWKTIPGMGHTFPDGVIPELVEALSEHVLNAR
ncbi:MAG TPA: alpha/beta hydrolase [Pseudomonadales bacterium]|nr:alpha/beta hydrolase [Pseudomonadales bacterium]